MFKKGDIVKIKSFDEVIEIEGLGKCGYTNDPHIAIGMLESFGKEGVVLGIDQSGHILLGADYMDETWYYNKKWIDKKEEGFKKECLMDDLVEKVEKWFIDRRLDKADPAKQMLKLYEEMGEVSAGLARNDIDEIKDEIGDVLVVLIGLSMQLGISVEECLNIAYNEIKDRKGKLVNGVFIKEEDLQKED